MNFEELYEKYQNNTATEEERAYVESEIAKAKKLSAIIDEHDARHALEKADESTVKSSVKRFLKRTKIRVAIIVTAALILLFALTIGALAAIAAVKANENGKIDRNEAIALCEDYMVREFAADKNALRVEESGGEINFAHGFNRVFYEYEIEIEYQGRDYEFWVSGATGDIRLQEID